jgi:hypothetical protein
MLVFPASFGTFLIRAYRGQHWKGKQIEIMEKKDSRREQLYQILTNKIIIAHSFLPRKCKQKD